MKLLIFSLLVFSSFASLAQADILNLKVTDSQFSPAHIQRPGEARILVNLKEAKTTLIVEQLFYCPPQMICAAVMPLPVVIELPITAVEENECGLRTITSQADHRAVGGLLKTLTVEDPSHSRCATSQSPLGKAIYTTMGSDSTHEESSMSFLPASEAFENTSQKLEMSSGAFTNGFSMYEKPVSGQLEIDDKQVTMTVAVRMNCGNGRPCPRYMPRPLVISLPIVSIEKSIHGDRILAQDSEFSEEGVRKTIEILDFRSCEACNQDPLQQVKANYRAQHETSDGIVQRLGTFYFY